jgi:hypothetical protein
MTADGAGAKSVGGGETTRRARLDNVFDAAFWTGWKFLFWSWNSGGKSLGPSSSFACYINLLLSLSLFFIIIT